MPLKYLLAPTDLKVHPEQNHDEHDEADGQRGTVGPVLIPQELIGHDVADHVDVVATHEIGDQVLTHGGHEDEHGATQNAAASERDGDAPEALPGFGSQVEGGFEEGAIQALEGRIEWDDREGQVRIDHANEHSRGVVEKLDRTVLVDDACLNEHLIDEARWIAQEEHPGEDAYEIARPERQDEKTNPEILVFAAIESDPVGHGIAQEQADGRGGEGEEKRTGKGVQVCPVGLEFAGSQVLDGEYILIVLQSGSGQQYAMGSTSEKAVVQHDEHGGDDEETEPEDDRAECHAGLHARMFPEQTQQATPEDIHKAS